jgi:malate dehydrogenase (oxaloacetate-decarboxylating)
MACFNDDLHVSNIKLTDMRVVIFGSGTAGTGIADQVRDAIAADSGKSKEDAAKQLWYVSSFSRTNSSS